MYRFLSQIGRACPYRDKRHRSAGEKLAHRTTARDCSPISTAGKLHIKRYGKPRLKAAGFHAQFLLSRQNPARCLTLGGKEILKCGKITKYQKEVTPKFYRFKPKSNPSEMVTESLTTRMSSSPRDSTQQT